MDHYFETHEYTWLNENNQNKICVSINNPNNRCFDTSISYIDNSFKYECSCNKEGCFHIQFLLYIIKKNYSNKLHHNYFSFDEEDKTLLYIPVKGSSNDLYGIEIKVDSYKTFVYQCSCGLKYTRKKRKKCKHIERVIDSLEDKFRYHLATIDTDTELEHICFENLHIC